MNYWPQDSIVLRDEDGDPTAAGPRAAPAIPARAVTLVSTLCIAAPTNQPPAALPAAVETAIFHDRQ